MERRSHRFAVLALVVLLHVPLYFALRQMSAPALRRDATPLRVEFVLDPTQAPPLPRPPDVRRSRRPTPRAASRAATVPPRAAITVAEPEVPQTVRLFADDGSLRIPSTLADDIAEKEIEGPATFHIPAGDAWVLREPRSPIDYAETRFARAFLPEGMNPVEEACWRNKGFAFIMVMLGSRDCANPGGKDPAPTPSMIVYGVDDAEDILRKTEDWARYNAR